MGNALLGRVVEWGCGIRKPVLIMLVVAEMAFAAAFIVIRLRPEFYLKALDLDRERNFTAAFSAVQFGWIAAVIVSFLLVPGMIIRSLRPLAWAAVAGFLFLGLDEYTRIHERLSKLLLPYEWVPRLTGDVGAWIPVYAVAAAMLLLMLKPSIKMAARLYRVPSMLFLTGLAMLFLGSVGCEIIAFEVLAQNRTDPLYPFAVAAEEFLEMSGVSLMLYAVLAFGAAQALVTSRSRNRNSAMALVNA